MIPLIPAVISAVPSLIKLFTSDNKTDAVIDLAKKAGDALGVEGKPETVLQHLSDNPDAVIKLKELELDGEKLDLEILKEKHRHSESENTNITNRWQSDNKTGGINAKIRPYSLIYLMLITSILALSDGNIGEFTVKVVWVNLFTALTISAFNAYFLYRTYEKHSSNKYKVNK